MKERGFLPFSLAGVVLVVLVLGMLGHSAWIRHQKALEAIEGEEMSEIIKLAEEVRGNLKLLLKRSVQMALLEVCEGAHEFTEGTRRSNVERVAGERFSAGLKRLSELYSTHDERVDLRVIEQGHHVEISEIGDGYVMAETVLPQDSVLVLTSSDGSLSVSIPLREVKTSVDARYFLLERKMKNFVDGRGGIGETWKLMEYARGWGEAWLTGKIHLSEGIDRALFQAAWSIHEYNSFGSFDYWGTASDLVGSARDILTGDTVVVLPISASEIGDMKQFVEGALAYAREADAGLGMLLEELSRAREAHEENQPAENVGRILDAAAEEAASIRSKVSGIEERFNQLLSYVSQRSAGDPMMESLYRGLTTRTLSPDLPAPKEQIGWGVASVCRKLSGLEEEIGKVSRENMTLGELDELLRSAESLVEALRLPPTANRWAVVKSYADDPPREVENRLPVYITESSGGTLGSLKGVLSGLTRNLDELSELPGELRATNVGEIPGLEDCLREKLLETPPDLGPNRNDLYRVFPPPPLEEDPGVSVFRELEIKEVKHTRLDPTGRLGIPGATPIPLPFLNIWLYWGWWETTIELGESVEEIYDFENPTILGPSEFGYVHKPLAYRWELPDETYKIDVHVVSLRPFMFV